MYLRLVVCPQLQLGDLINPHLCIKDAQRRKRFNNTHSYRRNSKLAFGSMDGWIWGGGDEVSCTRAAIGPNLHTKDVKKEELNLSG
jgi:hypothetical protein